MKYNINSYKHLRDALIKYSGKSIPTIYNYLAFKTPIAKDIALKMQGLGFKLDIWGDKKNIIEMKKYDKRNHLKI